MYQEKKWEQKAATIEDSIDALIQRWEDFIPKSRRRLITTTRNDRDNTSINETKMERKTTVWILQATSKRNLSRKNLDIAKKEKPSGRNWISSKSSTKQSHNNYVKARIDKTQRSRWRLCGDRDETVNHITNECCKIVQKENNTRHNRAQKVIQWEFCKKFAFDHRNKWNDMCTTHNTSSKMKGAKFFDILRYKRII